MEYSKINGQIRLCAWETDSGLRRPYLCSHHEYCCALGCCVSSAFSFYQLWYFWLLLLLLVLLCSGGGWWFRFRHGGWWSRQGTPDPSRSRRHRRRGGAQGGPRVYPHQYYGNGGFQNDYTLPPGYDKDPPSYNEVISHLSMFPKIEDLRANGQGTAFGGPNASGPSVSNASGVPGGTAEISPTAPESTDCYTALPPPPSYEMVLDLKRREVHVQDIEEEEEEVEEGTEPSINSTRERIRKLLGRMRSGGNSQEPPEGGASGEQNAALSSSSSASTPSSGLFTISRESLPSSEYYELQPSHMDQPPPPSPGFQEMGPSRGDSESSSHSDYSSSFISSPSSSSRSLIVSPMQTPTEDAASPAPLRDQNVALNHPTVPSPTNGETSEHTGASRPCTGRSILSRPTTSISARTLPPAREASRKTSLPGVVVEVEDDRGNPNEQHLDVPS